MKTCTKCLISKPTTEFFLRPKRKDGLESWCKKCSNANRRKNKLISRTAKGLCTACGTRPANPGRIKCQRCTELKAQYVKDNSAMHAAYDHNRRAKLKLMPGKLTKTDIESRKELDGFRCQRCGIFTFDLTVDHIVPVQKISTRSTPPGWRNDSTNIQSLCKKCNSTKNHKSWWDYRETFFDSLALVFVDQASIRTTVLKAAIRMKLSWRGPGDYWGLCMV